MNDGHTRHVEVPSVEDHRRLRAVAGLTPRSAAAAGLPNTVAGIVVRHGGCAVGMGRAIGDQFCFQVVDVAGEPEHQRSIPSADCAFNQAALHPANLIKCHTEHAENAGTRTASPAKDRATRPCPVGEHNS